ncbi:MAG: hypothetical protein R2867_13275 [Caldilineaceae bacterium]
MPNWSNGADRIANLYQNNGGSFAASQRWTTWWPTVRRVGGCQCNDGYLDLLLTGRADSGRVTRLYRNQAAAPFTGINTGLPALSNQADGGECDYDSDGSSTCRWPATVTAAGSL